MKIKAFMVSLGVVLGALILVFSLSNLANAWTLSWNASEGAGITYNVYYNDINTPDDITTVNNGANVTYDLEGAGLTAGARYEFWVTAVNVTGESPDSDHLRWTTPPSEPIIIEMMGAPVQIIINP